VKRPPIAGIHDQNAQTFSPTLTKKVNVGYGSYSDAQVEQQILDGINIHRQGAGLPPLTRVVEIDNMSERHSQYMAVESSAGLNLSHDGFKGRAKILTRQLKMRKAAENVAGVKGISRAALADWFVKGWINSKGHLRNLMGNYSYTGVGVYTAVDGTTFATQVFAK